MGAEAVLPGREPPVRAETLHESGRTHVARLFFPDRTVIRKDPLGLDAQQRLRHEVAILERLRGVAGVVQLMEAPRYPESIVLQDVGGTSLNRLPKPLAADEVIRLGIELARSVANMHGRGVLHQDINPTNIVLSAGGVPYLADFMLATFIAEIRPGFTHYTEFAGTLTYSAPEQTGRTGRSVDQRADLYSLGATLYELATGHPPFGSQDPLQLTHDHMARAPAPPADVNRAVPLSLSEIILHLLEKEPDNRYQTADGVVYDLEWLRDAQGRPEAADFRVGEHDFALRVRPPARLVGRDDEVAALLSAFDRAVAGRCRGVLVSGPPGVGKTMLVDELRPMVTRRDGWFVAGKFDQYRRDLEFDGVIAALRALGRLLLAEPDDALGTVRARILGAVGANAGLLTAMVPEFAALLAVPPDPGNPLTAQLRTQRAVVEVLRAVASPDRPVVLFVDDLQWAATPPLGVVDLVLTEAHVDGLLLVGAYREEGADASPRLSSMVSRWQRHGELQQLRLENLPETDSAAMVMEMLHVNPAKAAGLTNAINPVTSGNPYETVELLNALRRDDVLTATATGWRWDDEAVRAYLAQSDVAGLLAARVDAMPPTSRAMVEAMGCLGGRVELSLLQTAVDEPRTVVEQTLAPALDDGLLVVEQGAQLSVSFRHDRTREVMLRGLDSRRRQSLQLEMARRLAAVPELFAVSAEQYLPVVDAVDDIAERHRVVGLLRRAADQATLTGDYSLVNALLTAALRLIDKGERTALIEVHTRRHAALYGMGRLDEADEEYRTIEGLCTTAMQRADAAVVQVLSLTQRSRLADAIGLGLGLLSELGITVPSEDELATELDHQLDHLYQWLDHSRAADDLARPEVTVPTLLAASRLLNAVLPAVYFVGEHPAHAWLCLEALRIWLKHGPGRSFIGPVSTGAFAIVTMRGDYSAGYRAVRRVLEFGEARGYEPDTSHARFLYSVLCGWFESIEHVVEAGKRARDGLIAGGDLANAGYTWQSIVAGLMDCAPSLDSFVAEVDSGLAFARRTGSEQTAGQWLHSYRWLVATLRGERTPSASKDGAIDTYASNPLSLFFAYVTRALAAAIFGDEAGLTRYSAAATPLTPTVSGHYVTAVAQLLRGLALSAQLRATEGRERADLLSELDGVTQWLAARAEDAPTNFLHLLRLLEAERAWATGDFRAAAVAFDAALAEATKHQRPWHRALIAEQAARFYLAHGVEHTGHDLLGQARRQYMLWGATAKVDQLDWAYPVLRTTAAAIATDGRDQVGEVNRRRLPVTTGRIDLLGILSMSQALSSETSIEGLHARVVELLSAMTGATGVHLLLCSEDGQSWFLASPGRDDVPAPVSAIGRDTAVPLSALRYVQRVRELLVVADATRDERFSRDPYFVDADCCSLLAVPIFSRGTLRAVLLLENRLMRGAFTAERLDGVNLIAGQLAVSLDNVQLYTDFRRIADEQAALRRVATLIARGVEPSEVFDAVTDEMRQCLRMKTGGLWRFEPSGEITLLAASAEPALRAKWPVGTRTPIEGDNLASVVLKTGKPARMDDYANAAGPVAARVRELGVRAAVGVPIVVDGRVWGIAAVGSVTPGPLPAEAEERVNDFAELVATAIANAVARSELRASRDHLGVLATQQSALRRVATLVARGVSSSKVFSTVAEEMARCVDVHNAEVFRFEPDHSALVVASYAESEEPHIPVGERLNLVGDNVPAMVLRTGLPARMNSYEGAAGPLAARLREMGVHCRVGAPIVVNERIWGIAVVGSSRPEPLPPDTEERIAEFAELVATAIAAATTRAELIASRARIVAATDETRRRLERNLHDGAQQRAVSLGLRLSMAKDSVPAELAELKEQLAEIGSGLTGLSEELREISQGIHPAILSKGGLGPAIKTLARRSTMPVTLDIGVRRRLPEAVEVAAYYLVAEAFTNAAKYAHASVVTVQADADDENLDLCVCDDGVGGADSSGGSGLLGLKDRVEALGGQLEIFSPVGSGTSLHARISLRRP